MKPTKTAGWTGVEMNKPQKTNMDTQHDGLERTLLLKNTIYIKFLGCTQ